MTTDEESKKARQIVHVNVGDSLVIHCADQMVLLSAARLVSYSTQLGGTPSVTFEGVSLRTMKADEPY